VSTRGLLAFRFEGQDYVTYNYSDSYPRALGTEIVKFAQEHLNLEFWDLPERAVSFPLATITPCAVGVMDCERRSQA